MYPNRVILFWTISLCILIGCKESKTYNEFSSDQDTLIIHTEKQRGLGYFPGGLGSLTFRDIQDSFPHQIKLPEGLTKVERTMVKPYFGAENPVYLNIIKGTLDKERVFIVDQNNNRDLTDDSVRVFSEIIWKTEADLIDVKYQLEGNGPVRSSWVKMGEKHGNLLYGRYEHLKAKILFNQIPYELGAVDTWNTLSFNYSYEPEIAVLSEGFQKKDTLKIRDLIKQHEFVKLGETYYRFDSITISGDQIFLVKENNFEKQIGTQVGVIAPEFEGVSTVGDTIRSGNMVGKPIIMSNSCGCGGDEKSTQAYFDILQSYGDQMNVLRLDSHIEDDVISAGIHFDMERDDNRSMYNDYRMAYCSRVCYVIGVDRRIIDKFQITDWEENLASLSF